MEELLNEQYMKKEKKDLPQGHRPSAIPKYYHCEDKNPYPADDIRNKFWHGEMMFVTTHQIVGEWKEEGKKCLENANEDIRKLAARLTPEQFGVVIYISSLFGKWCPYDDQSWIVDY